MAKDMNGKVRDKIGTVRVADDVVPVIAALAAAEVEGVVAVAENLTGELIKWMGGKKAPKGVRVDIVGRKVSVDMKIGIDADCNVPETSRKVQDKVTEAIENMTGLEVTGVNIRIASVVLANA